MYKLHKISQRFLCRIPIYSKQGAPGPPARLCAMVHVYPYPGTPYPYTHGTTCLLPTYIHALIHLFYLFILLSLSLFILLSLSLLLFSSLLLSLLSLYPCHWQDLPFGRGAAGFILLVRANILFYLIIIQQYTCIVWYVCIYMCCIVYVYVSSIIHVSNRCMYVHSVLCTVQCAHGPVHAQ